MDPSHFKRSAPDDEQPLVLGPERKQKRNRNLMGPWCTPTVGFGLIGLAIFLSIIQQMVPMPPALGVIFIFVEFLFGAAGILVLISYNTRPRLGTIFRESLFNVPDEDDH